MENGFHKEKMMKIGKIRMNMFGKELLTEGKNTFMNVGDSVQAVAMSRLYRKIGIKNEDTVLLPRFSMLKQYEGKEQILLPYHGVFSTNTVDSILPFPECIKPVFLSVNVGDDFLLERPDLIDYFKQHEPIGCRDEKTRTFFRNYGIRAYLMGCFTISLDGIRDASPSKIILSDLSENALKHIPEHMKTSTVSISHNEKLCDFPVTMREDDRLYNIAKKYLQEYCNASLVITSRMHVAAPCIAMGTPVILMNDNIDYRYEWIDKFIPFFQLPDYSNIDWSKITTAQKKDVEFAKKNLFCLFEAVLSQKPYEHFLYELDSFLYGTEKNPIL